MDLKEACLLLAERSKSNLGFGAVLVKDGRIAGVGWNRLSTKEERATLSHIDYAIHAEQAAIIDAINQGVDVRDTDVYVLGKVLRGKTKGRLTTRTVPEFGCIKCPHAFIRYNIHINVPSEDGWFRLSPEEALTTAKKSHGNGKWKKITEDKNFPL